MKDSLVISKRHESLGDNCVARNVVRVGPNDLTSGIALQKVAEGPGT